MRVDELESLLLGCKKKKIKLKETKKIGICIGARSLWRFQSVEIIGERYWREVAFS